jgi:hypothetical protein
MEDIDPKSKWAANPNQDCSIGHCRIPYVVTGSAFLGRCITTILNINTHLFSPNSELIFGLTVV